MILLRFASPLLSQSCARSLFVAAVLVSGFCSQANAQALPLVDQVKGVKSADRFDVERLNAINTFMNKAVEDGVIVGSSALIFQDGKEAFFNTWGYHDRANKRADESRCHLSNLLHDQADNERCCDAIGRAG